VKREPPAGIPASPPLRFPLYGLDGSRPGERWLDSYGDALGEEVRWARLSQYSQETGDLIMVETHSRPLADAEEARGGEAALQSVSYGAAFTLVNLTLPDLSVPRPEGLLRALVNHAAQKSKRHADWAPVTWQVDGLPVPARAWEFAGGWAAFSDGLDEVYLAASGSGGSPDGLALTRLRDARAYHFDLAQPLDLHVIKASGTAAWPGDEPAWRHAGWHPDQLRLLPGRTQKSDTQRRRDLLACPRGR
jgi:hypothetical protein